MGEDKRRALVLELFAEGVQAGIETAANEKREYLVRFVEGLWGKYSKPEREVLADQRAAYEKLKLAIASLGYAG